MIINWGRGPYWDGPGFVRSRPFPPQPPVPQSDSDNVNVSLTESASFALAGGSGTDQLNVGITASARIEAQAGAQRDYIGGPVLIGLGSRRRGFFTHKIAAESLAVSFTESASVRFPNSSSDSLNVAFSESSRLNATARQADSNTLAVSITGASSVSIGTPTVPIQNGTGSQTGYVGGVVYIGQGRRFFPQSSSPGEPIRVSLGEAAIVAVHLSASDDLGVGSTPGSDDTIVSPVDFGPLLVTVDSPSLALAEGALVSSTSGSVVNWSTLIDPDLSIRVFEHAHVVTINNQRLYNEVVGLRIVEQASRLHIFPTGGATVPAAGDTVGVGTGEGFQNSFTGVGNSRLGTYGYLKLRIVESATIGVASTAQARNTATWLDVAFTANSAAILLSQVGIEVIYRRVPARTTTDTAWPTTAQIQQDYPVGSYVDFSFTG